jgi:succinate dehydrogenase / fumarate reductase iron-sulfur subunit
MTPSVHLDHPGPRPTRASTRQLRVFRWTPGRGDPAMIDYEVPVEPSTTVLDALREVRLHQDVSLALRYSCCHSSCGTCGVRVNGAEVLACVTVLADLPDDVVEVEPMANATVISDLVVDTADFYERFAVADRPLIRHSESTSAATDPRYRFEDCVECGLCLSACPIVATDPGYLGPAALGAAARVVAEPRGADPARVLGLVDDDEGCWRCHVSMECSAVCPTGADPAGGIMSLRRDLTRRRLLTLVPGRRP